LITSSSELNFIIGMIGPNAYKSNARMNQVSSCWSIQDRKIFLNNSWLHYMTRISYSNFKISDTCIKDMNHIFLLLTEIWTKPK
jgi:hypothetical protein